MTIVNTPPLDLFGSPLAIGDTVGFKPPYANDCLITGKITKVFLQMVEIEYDKPHYQGRGESTIERTRKVSTWTVKRPT